MQRLWFALLLLAVVSCRPRGPASTGSVSAPEPSSPHPQVVLPDRAVVRVELATDDETRSQGLMYRESVPEGTGMLFLFPASDVFPFWMKNTMVPLDIIWIDEARRVVHVAEAVPPCQGDPCPSYSPGVAARYVLELRSGAAKAHRVMNGARVELRNMEGVQVR